MTPMRQSTTTCALAALAAVAVVAWLLSYRAGSTWLRPVLCLGIFFAVLFPSQSGAFFGVVDAKLYWHSALLPILFLTSAVTAGAAMLLLVVAILTAVARRDWVPRTDAVAAEAVAAR